MGILRLYREACLNPGGEPAQQGIDTCIAIVQKEERRTSALMFVRSGTVGDDPLVFIERHSRDVSFDGAKRNGDRPDRMALRKGLWTAHIYQDRRAAVECRLCFLKGNARHLRLGLRKIVRRLAECGFDNCCWR